MQGNLRTRNIAINSYLGILITTLVGACAALIILHVANDVPFKAFASADTYTIDSSL